MSRTSIAPRLRQGLRDPLVTLLGWHATILHGDPTVVNRWRWLRRHLHAGPLRTLDAGCGSGAFTMYAALKGNWAVGIANEHDDIVAAERRAALLGLPILQFVEGDLRELDRIGNALGRFDQILLLECIEHIRDDEKLVADLAALLRPGGTILITTPNLDHRPLFGERVSPSEDGGHVRYGYDQPRIETILVRNGLEVIAIEFIGGVVVQKLASLQFALCRINRVLAWTLTLPLRILRPLDGPLTRLLGYPHLSIGIVGRKPD